MLAAIAATRAEADQVQPAAPFVLGNTIVGYECDGCEIEWVDGLLSPTHRGGTVVTVGTTDWAHGLADDDPNVVTITRNILDRLFGS